MFAMSYLSEQKYCQVYVLSLKTEKYSKTEKNKTKVSMFKYIFCILILVSMYPKTLFLQVSLALTFFLSVYVCVFAESEARGAHSPAGIALTQEGGTNGGR